MSRSTSTFRRLIAPAAFAAALTIGSVPAFAQTTPTANCADVHFELANPAPGSMLEPGGLVIEGIAMDSRATEGVGIDRVDFFLGNRDEGGLSVGMAVPGSTAGPFGAGSFHTTVDLPEITGGNDLFGYAHSSITGQEFVISVPISIGEDPVVAGVASEGVMPTMTETCTPAPTSEDMTVPTGSPTPENPATTTTPTTTTTPLTESMITLDIANPEPDATILAGAYVIQGMAMDHAADAGVGIDRIDVFLEDRDEGGTFLGTAAVSGAAGMAPGSWTVTVELPDNMTGVHSLWFYAQSTAGGEKVVEVPVTIE
jgi:hypothetical protein